MGEEKAVVTARIDRENLAYLNRDFAANHSAEVNRCISIVRTLEEAGTLQGALLIAQGLLRKHWRAVTPEELGMPQKAEEAKGERKRA